MLMMNQEWQRRLGRWRETMPRLFYRELGTIDLQGFCTMEHITPAQAEK